MQVWKKLYTKLKQLAFSFVLHTIKHPNVENFYDLTRSQTPKRMRLSSTTV